MKEQLQKFRKFFSELKLWEKLKGFAQQVGVKSVYIILLMYYSYKREDTPFWVKKIIIGVLGYFIAIVDFIPDLTPFIGITDDIGVFMVGLTFIAAYVNDDVKEKAREELKQWFDDIDYKEIEAIDKML